MKKSVWLGLLFVAVVVGFVVYSTLNTGRIRCEVCITYRGQQACRTAAASTRDLALRTATENACATLASGVTDSNQCNNTPPDSVRWP
ncbi:MAG TPA: hypothetical protein VMI94_01975 [Bryobacteraceae bacterium]|nr:hypothetical protein [Bryobacteraceae bacterium]